MSRSTRFGDEQSRCNIITLFSCIKAISPLSAFPRQISRRSLLRVAVISVLMTVKFSSFSVLWDFITANHQRSEGNLACKSKPLWWQKISWSVHRNDPPSGRSKKPENWPHFPIQHLLTVPLIIATQRKSWTRAHNYRHSPIHSDQKGFNFYKTSASAK